MTGSLFAALRSRFADAAAVLGLLGLVACSTGGTFAGGGLSTPFSNATPVPSSTLGTGTAIRN